MGILAIIEGMASMDFLPLARVFKKRPLPIMESRNGVNPDNLQQVGVYYNSQCTPAQNFRE